MKTKLPPMPIGGESMLFGVTLTDAQLDCVVTAMFLYQCDLKEELEADESPEDRDVLERMINDIELISLSCPDYVQAIYDQDLLRKQRLENEAWGASHENI